jgi:hypothetical protein
MGSLLSGLAGAALKAAGEWLLALIGQRQARADTIALGQQQQKTVDAEAALDAEKRINAAAAEPVETDKRLGDGTF